MAKGPTKNTYPITNQMPTVQAVEIGGSFSVSGSMYEETHYIPDGKIVDFVRSVLGWSFKQGVYIARKLPARHPEIPYLWASRISSIRGLSCTGMRPVGLGFVPSYKQLEVKVQYETPPFSVLQDWEASFEYERFVVTNYHTSGEFIQNRQGTFSWPSTAPSGVRDTNDPATQQKASIPEALGAIQTITKTELTFLWVQVPDDGFFDSGGCDDGGRPAKQDAGLGRVNLNTWHGYPAGTLLFNGYEPTPTVLPVPPETLGLTHDSVPRAWDVKMSFTYFDPPPRDTNKRGWNLVPNPQDNLWDRALRTAGSRTAGLLDDVEANWLYGTYDFNKLFEMN